MGLKTNKKRRRKVQKINEEIPAPKSGLVLSKDPRILVIHRGSVGPIVPHLIQDVKTMLAPHVINTIKVLRNAKVKDLVAAAGGLKLSHTIIFTRTDQALYMKLCTMPRGPTITFSIDNYSLSRDVMSYQKRPASVQPGALTAPPCLMIYNLQPHTGPRHLQLVASSMLQVFSTFTPGQCSSHDIKRCCLLNYDDETGELDLRHYCIQLKSAGAAKLVMNLANSKNIPNLNSYDCIEDAFERAGAASESEGEEDTKIDITDIKQEHKYKPPVSRVTSVKMKDTGPRISMKIQKVEAGFLGGEVLYNRTQKLTPEEIQNRALLRETKKKEKIERKQQQEANVERKKQEAEDHKQQCLKGMPEEQQQRALKNKQKDMEDSDDNDGDDEAEEEEDEAQYYKDAIGEAPEEELALRMKKTKRLAEDDEDASTKAAAKKAKISEKKKERESKLEKAQERYKMLDQRSKTNRPRSFGKRLAKKLKTKAKERRSETSAEAAEGKETGQHKENNTKSSGGPKKYAGKKLGGKKKGGKSK